ncbi:MAG: tyrosine-type recombinase/integrase [Burkholderiaceae bacterium]
MGSVYRRGKKWRAQTQDKSETATFVTKAAAQAWVNERESYLLAGKQGRVVPFTVADACNRFAEEVCPNRKGERWERLRLAKYAADLIGSIRLRDITTGDLAGFRDRRLLEVSNGTVRRDFALLGAVFTRCRLEWGWLKHNPMEGFKRPKPPSRRKRRVYPAEIDQICKALGYSGGAIQTQQHRVAVMFLLAIETAMRAGEINSIRRLHGNIVVLTDTKNDDSREVPLTPRAIELVKILIAAPGRITAQTLDATFRRARDKARIDNLTFHDTRHEAITRLAKKMTVLELARAVGHRNINQLLTYYEESASEIADRLANA